MILKIDFEQRVIYIDEPFNLGEFFDNTWDLVDDDYEWIVVPKQSLMVISQS